MWSRKDLSQDPGPCVCFPVYINPHPKIFSPLIFLGREEGARVGGGGVCTGTCPCPRIEPMTLLSVLAEAVTTEIFVCLFFCC